MVKGKIYLNPIAAILKLISQSFGPGYIVLKINTGIDKLWFFGVLQIKSRE